MSRHPLAHAAQSLSLGFKRPRGRVETVAGQYGRLKRRRHHAWRCL